MAALAIEIASKAQSSHSESFPVTSGSLGSAAFAKAVLDYLKHKSTGYRTQEMRALICLGDVYWRRWVG